MIKQFVIVPLLVIAACANPPKKTQALPHYDLTRPETFSLPAVLREVSGIAFRGGDDTLYAEQDEEGRLFRMKWQDVNIQSSKFGKKGDYEDVAIAGNTVVMLRSDGVLISFPVTSAQKLKVPDAREWTGLLPEGEFESMFADSITRNLYVLCKHCPSDKSEGITSGFIFSVSPDGIISSTNRFSVDVKTIESLSNIKKMHFRPSALAKEQTSGDWYIVSSVNSMLVITDSNWRVKQIVPLEVSVFGQPEGIAFDKKRNLYISNEGTGGRPGNILKFAYRE